MSKDNRGALKSSAERLSEELQVSGCHGGQQSVIMGLCNTVGRYHLCQKKSLFKCSCSWNQLWRSTESNPIFQYPLFFQYHIFTSRFWITQESLKQTAFLQMKRFFISIKRLYSSHLTTYCGSLNYDSNDWLITGLGSMQNYNNVTELRWNVPWFIFSLWESEEVNPLKERFCSGAGWW